MWMDGHSWTDDDSYRSTRKADGLKSADAYLWIVVKYANHCTRTNDVKFHEMMSISVTHWVKNLLLTISISNCFWRLEQDYWISIAFTLTLTEFSNKPSLFWACIKIQDSRSFYCLRCKHHKQHSNNSIMYIRKREIETVWGVFTTRAEQMI